MGRRSPLLAALAALAAPALSAPAPSPQTFPIDYGDVWARQQFSCPLWGGELPQSAQDLANSTCSNLWTRTHTVGQTTARLYPVPGPWQEDSRANEISNGVFAAIQKGLASFGALAGPLTIHIGIVYGVLGDQVQVDDNNRGVSDPCYILFDYPPSSVAIPLAAMQKDIIMGMYHCVQQFHRPTLNAWTESNKWWRHGSARYFDGLSYAAGSNILTRGEYPEEYSFGVTLYQNDYAASLFFHYLDSLAGWTPTNVHDYVRTKTNTATYELERRALAADAKIPPALWHGFILAAIDGTIAYPAAAGGTRIATQDKPPRRTYPVVNIAAVGGNFDRTISIAAWKGSVHVLPVKAGHRVRLSVETQPGIEWSVRRVGTTAWNRGDRTRSVDLAAPAGATDTSFELAASSTRDDAGSFYASVLFERIG